MRYRIIAVFAIGAILLGLAYDTVAWASPEPSAGRQGGTVPTRTPKPAPTQQEKDKPTATFVAPTQPVGITPGIVGTVTLAPVGLTTTPMVAPVLPTNTMTPPVTIVPSVVVTPAVLSSPVPPQIIVESAQPIAPSVSNTPAPALTWSPTPAPATNVPNYNWLLPAISLVLIAGGAALALMRSQGQRG